MPEVCYLQNSRAGFSVLAMCGVSDTRDSRGEEATNGLFLGFFKTCELCTGHLCTLRSPYEVQKASMIGLLGQNTYILQQEVRARTFACR